jgi:hypothetical protein
MRRIWAKNVLVIGVGVAAMFSQGCKRHAAPAPVQTQRVMRHSAPMPEPSVDLFPDTPAPNMVQPQARRHHRVEMPQAVPTPEDSQQAAAEAMARQREQDARLEQQQEAESQKAQRELDHEVEQDQKAQEQIQEEPRIQDAPGPEQMGLPPGLEGEPGQPGQEPPRIQDAPGPAQTLPQPQPHP